MLLRSILGERVAVSEAVRIRRSNTDAVLIWICLFAAALVLLGRLSGLGEVAEAQTFAIIFTAIAVEALPFVLLGAVVAAAIEVFVSEDTFARVARLPVGLQLPAAAMGGFAFPVCECGSVPVARRLIARGMHPTAGLAFMLASPIFNPVVLGSTWVAYSPRGLALPMVLGRAGLGLLLALAVGWALGTEGSKELLKARAQPDSPSGEHDDHASTSGRRDEFVRHLTGDFFFMGKFLVAGAALSAALQTVIPQSIIGGVARTPIIASLAMMAVAFVSSLCSEADAFVAVSFGQFPLGSQLAFLVFGPVLDFKLSFLYAGTFRKHFVLRLLLVTVPVVLAGSLWFEAITGRLL